jgi:glycerophosphoryl diester phosphodiesterase
VAFVTILGHRGFPREHPENSVDAFRACLATGADGVELDVRFGSGGELLVLHDPLPDALPGYVPTLVQALAACAGAVVNVEIKNLPTEPTWDPTEAIAAPVVEAIRGGEVEAVVSAFTLATIDAVRALDPGLRTGWLTVAGFDQLAALETAAERGHTDFHPHETAVTAELVERTHAAGLCLTTWTVDDPDRMRELADWGVDCIITNVPDLAVATLR